MATEASLPGSKIRACRSATTSRRSTHFSATRCASAACRSTSQSTAEPRSAAAESRHQDPAESAPRRWRGGPTQKWGRSPPPNLSPLPSSTTESASSPLSPSTERSPRRRRSRRARFEIAVNFSGRLLGDRGPVGRIAILLERHRLEARHLALELTETAALAEFGKRLTQALSRSTMNRQSDAR